MQNSREPVYVVKAIRTPVGKAPRGVFNKTRPDDLLGVLLKAMLTAYPTLPPSKIEDVIVGCAMPEAEQGMNMARSALLLAGLPDSVPGMTINRFCASGLQAISLAADRIANGEADVILAGGAESMSLVPMGGYDYRPNPLCFENNEFVSIAYGMGITAEIVANRYHISREAQDQFALQSHQRAISAIQSGFFENEIIPVEVTMREPQLNSGIVNTATRLIKQDEGPRADTNLQQLASLRTVFDATGTITAGTSSQMSDGAGLVLLVSERALKAYELTPCARFHGYAITGVPPEVMGIGPVVAIPQLLKKSGISLEDISWIELNEAFAAQSLAVIQELKLDPARVNPQGGAIALGHPLGATGAIRTATLLEGLRRNKNRYGMVTMCIGTGMGAAGLFECF